MQVPISDYSNFGFISHSLTVSEIRPCTYSLKLSIENCGQTTAHGDSSRQRPIRWYHRRSLCYLLFSYNTARLAYHSL